MPRMFGTAGVRGRTNEELTPALVMRLGAAYGLFLGEGRRLAVGRDTRYGADMLARAAIAGLQSVGAQVQDLGVVPTGALASWIAREELHGGVLLTGSHMPPERIGLILLQQDGTYLPDVRAEEVEQLYDRLGREWLGVSASQVGDCERRDVLDSYVEDLRQRVDADAIRGRKLKVLVDPANGTAALVHHRLFEPLCEELGDTNAAPGPVPGREAEPRARSLEAAARLVRQGGYDLGLATDIDADRVVFIDAKGAVVSEDCVGAIFADRVLEGHRGRTAVFPVNASGLIELVCERHGVEVQYCSPGQPATQAAVKQHEAVYSYEESGKYYFCLEAAWCDGLFSALKLMELMAREQKALSELASEYPLFFQVKRLVPCGDERKAGVMEAVREKWEKNLLEGRLRDVTFDGLKRMYQDQSWLLLRASGTEPLIRVYSDSRSQQRAEELVEQGVELVQAVLE